MIPRTLAEIKKITEIDSDIQYASHSGSAWEFLEWCWLLIKYYPGVTHIYKASEEELPTVSTLFRIIADMTLKGYFTRSPYDNVVPLERQSYVTDIPECLGKLTQLSKLNMMNQRLTEIPIFVGLRELYIGYNNIREIPQN